MARRLALPADNSNSGRVHALDEAVLVTGLYGAGKSSLVAEMAETLEMAGISFGAIDVDWLSWYHLPDAEATSADLRSQNLADVASRYLSAGVRRLMIAEATRHDGDVDSLARLLRCPLRVVRLDVPMSVVETRLRSDPTSGRAHDLQVAHEWARRGWGTVSAGLVLDGTASLGESARAVLTWLGWLPTRPG